MPLVSLRRFHGDLSATAATLATAALLLGVGPLGATRAGAETTNTTTAATAPGVRAVLLPIPAAPLRRSPVDISSSRDPLGAMASTTSSLQTLPDGSSVGDSNAERWLPTAGRVPGCAGNCCGRPARRTRRLWA
jgi:hypothetical protein